MATSRVVFYVCLYQRQLQLTNQQWPYLFSIPAAEYSFTMLLAIFQKFLIIK